MNFLFDPDADFCDRHETSFKLGERCPVCLKAEPEHQAQMKWARGVVQELVIPPAKDKR